MYHEIKPQEEHNSLIDSFWTFSNNKEQEHFKILPDTCADLIFDLNQNKGFLSGIMTKYQPQALSAQANIIGVRFKTENFGFLSKIPLDETKNLRVELSEILTTERLDTLNQLTDLEGTMDKIAFIENFIKRTSRELQKNQDQLVLSVAQNIRTMQGLINTSTLAKTHFISLRQLERRFKRYIGLSLKEFSNIVRFNIAKQSIIASRTKKSLLEIAFDTGYFDHAHMHYEFKRMAGENPSYFR